MLLHCSKLIQHHQPLADCKAVWCSAQPRMHEHLSLPQGKTLSVNSSACQQSRPASNHAALITSA